LSNITFFLHVLPIALTIEGIVRRKKDLLGQGYLVLVLQDVDGAIKVNVLNLATSIGTGLDHALGLENISVTDKGQSLMRDLLEVTEDH